jgi:NTE family protein
MANWGRAAAIAVLLATSGCAQLESIYRPVETAALKGPSTALHDTRCDAPDDPKAPAPSYSLRDLKDCTSQDSLIVFAFSGGGIRSAAFGYGVLSAAHTTAVPDAAGGHTLDKDIDIVSGVSGGSFTAAAFANHRDALFPKPGAPDYYRDKFLTHDFFADLLSIYFAPWHWQWMLPSYSSQDEMAKIYGAMEFSSHDDRVFAPTYGDLAKKGRPLLVVQATDYGNEQPFTFTQADFDLICSDLNAYPVGNAVAASSAFPVLFSPIRLTNHHHDNPKPGEFCATHRPRWVDDVLGAPEPVDLSRLYARAHVVDGYLPPAPGAARKTTKVDPPRYVFLQDGGVTDNVALRGLTNLMLQYTGESSDAAWNEQTRAAACRGGWGAIRRVVIVAVDGEAQPANTVSSLPYLSDLALILNVTSSAMIDANGFETMLATDALTKVLAQRLSKLKCEDEPDSHEVKAYFSRVSFQDIAEETVLNGTACGRDAKESCTMGDLARSETSLNFSGEQVDALIAAGRSAFQCNRKIAQILKDVNAKGASSPALACRSPAAKPNG